MVDNNSAVEAADYPNAPFSVIPEEVLVLLKIEIKHEPLVCFSIVTNSRSCIPLEMHLH